SQTVRLRHHWAVHPYLGVSGAAKHKDGQDGGRVRRALRQPVGLRRWPEGLPYVDEKDLLATRLAAQPGRRGAARQVTARSDSAVARSRECAGEGARVPLSSVTVERDGERIRVHGAGEGAAPAPDGCATEGVDVGEGAADRARRRQDTGERE